MGILLLGFLFGLRVKPVYSTSFNKFSNEIVDVSYNKYGYPIFVLTEEDVIALGINGKRMFDKPKMGIYIPSSVYTLHIGDKDIEYINFRGRIRHTIKAPDGVFLGASKNLLHLFWKDKNSIFAIDYDGKLLYRINTNEIPIIFPDGKLLFVGKKLILYNIEGIKLWERDNIMQDTPEFISQPLKKDVYYFILFNKISGISAGFDVTGKIYWLKRVGIPVSISPNGRYFLSFEGKNIASAYKFDSGVELWKCRLTIPIKSGIMLNNGYSILGGKNRAYIVDNKGNTQKIIRTKYIPLHISYKDSILTLVGEKSISVYKVKIR